MGFPIEKKLVVAVASSALFKLDAADAVFRKQGVAAYREYQRAHQAEILGEGIAFAFVKRLLELNQLFPEERPAEVVLLSHNDPDTGLRVFNSIEHYGLDITRAAFTTGESPFKYAEAFNVSLFLSADGRDVKEALAHGCAAGQVVGSPSGPGSNDRGLCVAFDFDGVIADDSAEKINAAEGLEAFHASEAANAATPLPPGPLARFFRQLGALHELEDARLSADPAYERYLRLVIVTARSAPAHARVAATLRSWKIVTDQVFFLGGMDKNRVLDALRPHIFFDDQKELNLSGGGRFTPSVHIPFGIKNRDGDK